MSSNLAAAFNTLLQKKRRQVTITRPSTSFETTIYVSPSNYSRNLQGPGDTIIRGKEFVISKQELVSKSYPLPLKRGDRMQDPEMGLMVISEVEEMFDLGAVIIGYRVRCS